MNRKIKNMRTNRPAAPKPRRAPVRRPKKPGATAPEGKLFALCLSEALVEKGFPAVLGRSSEPLAELPYSKELAVKNKAFREFWSSHKLPDKPTLIVPSPLQRAYRTTSKRKVLVRAGKTYLVLEERETSQLPKEPPYVSQSLLEPEAHAAIYAFLAEKLNTSYAVIASALNYVIIRGSYTEFCVIFNLARVNSLIVRKMKALGDHLQKLPQSVIAGFLFLDASRSAYYLDNKESAGPWKLKKLFGRDNLFLKVGENKFLYDPTAFSQINASILENLLEKARQLLKPRTTQRLLDLYCGYGLFGLGLRKDYAEIVGVDAAPQAIASARSNAQRDKTLPPIHLFSAPINASVLEKRMPGDPTLEESVVLDPPRQGVESGVIKALAGRAPKRVLHVFCNTDNIPASLRAWRQNGYMVGKVIPMDFFPGTDKLEVLVLLMPDQYGLLNRVAPRVPPAH